MQDIRWKQRFENFEKALKTLEIVLQALNQDSDSIINKMATIQAYEVAFELAWKTLKDFLSQKGVIVTFPRDVIKEAFSYEIIEDGETWIKMLDDRNLTTHTYDETKTNQVVNNINTCYFQALQQEYTYLKDEV